MWKPEKTAFIPIFRIENVFYCPTIGEIAMLFRVFCIYKKSPTPGTLEQRVFHHQQMLLLWHFHTPDQRYSRLSNNTIKKVVKWSLLEERGVNAVS